MADRIQMETGVTGSEAPMEIVEDTTEAERPEWLPEKFDSAESMAKAYSELESRMGQDTEEVETTDHVESDEADELVEATGITPEAIQEYSTEFYEQGELSEESLSRIESEFGIPKDLTKDYVEGQKARISQAQNSIFDEVGGQESYSSMLEWAKDNLSQEDIAAYDAAIVSNDINTAKMVAKGLHAQYTAANGDTPNLARGNVSPTGGSEGYQSWQQVSSDMQTAKYKNDPAFRQHVQDKLAVSNLTQ